ncbi:MAG: DUF3575 domain-containing protein [Bacteroidetes bacterium]|nr:DUF3575 domain-containing protein [Bacteroidota bacterium]
MNKLRTYILICFCWFVLPSNAQRTISFHPDSVARKHALKINLLSPLFLTLNLAHEVRLNSHQSMQQVLAYTYFYANGGNKKITDFKGLYYTLDYRIYGKNKKAWQGGYLNPFIRYNYINHKYYITDTTTNITKNYQEKLQGLSLGFAWGKQKIYRNKFLIDYSIGIFASLPLNRYQSEGTPTEIPDDTFVFYNSPFTDGIGIRPVLRFGYLF